jgi:hypothetical protein
METTFETAWSDHWLPRAPLAGDVKNLDPQVHRHTREVALTMPYVEANPLAVRSLIVTDHDGADADLIAALAGLPEPSYIALNARTRAGHIVYALAAPVCLTDAARRRPMNLLARIESGLTTVLGGDVAYGGRITKNPFHQDHLPLWGDSGAVFGLHELAAALDGLGALPDYSPRQTLLNSTIGRNCALFDLTRRWAYRAWPRYPERAEWEEVTHAYAMDRNLSVVADEFTRGPLGDQEVTHLARSVARWVWRSDMRAKGLEQYEADFRLIQSARGKKITEKRREANRQRRTVLNRALVGEML